MKAKLLYVSLLLTLLFGIASSGCRVPSVYADTGIVPNVWGDNVAGNLDVPPNLTDVTALAGGGYHSLALKSDGTVVAWGCRSDVYDYDFGQCTVPAGLSGVIAISAGDYHSLALKSDGTVVAWGCRSFDYGQCTIPTGLSGVTDIAAGGRHNMALKNDGTVVAWGDYYYGAINVPSDLSGVTDIAAGWGHSLALKSDGAVVGWGDNFHHQSDSIPGPTNIIAIAAGGDHSLALRSDGTVFPWGRFYEDENTVPPDLNNAIAIAAGQFHNMALRSDGTVAAWGWAGYGLNTVPPGLHNVIAIAAGAGTSMALGEHNHTPVAANDSYSTNEDNALNIVHSGTGLLANDTDEDDNILTSVLVSGPEHGTLMLVEGGYFSYNPDPNYNGPDSFTYKATDDWVSSNIATASILVNPVNDAPVGVIDAYDTDEDTALTIGALAGVLSNDTDADGSPLTAALVGNPAHGTLVLNTDGSFSYTPAANYAGPDSFTYKASDGILVSTTATVNITVNTINDSPVARDETYSTNEDTVLPLYSANVMNNDTDPDGNILTAILVSTTEHGVLVLNANGYFIYSPATNYYGPDSFTYKVNDGMLDSNVATVSITVEAVNDAPITVNDAYATDEDTPLTVAATDGLLNNDSDVEGDPLTAVLVTGPARGRLVLNADGSFAYTPYMNYSGVETFTYRASDGALRSTVTTVSITMKPINDAPAAHDDSYSTNEDIGLTIDAPGVLSNDTDADENLLTVVMVSSPTQGALSLNSDGSFIYVPSVGFSGVDSFTYKANDGILDSRIATVSIVVNHVNHAPSATGDDYTTKENATFHVIPSFGVLSNDTDPDGDTLAAILVAGPEHGELTLNADGSFSYTPERNYFGPDSFTYKASDGQQYSDPVRANITINEVNEAPVALEQSVTTDQDMQVSITLVATDADNNPLTYMIMDGPAHGSLMGTAPDVTYTPDTGYHGSDSFTFKAEDGELDSNIATVSIIINHYNHSPAAVNDAYATSEDTVLTIGAPAGVLSNDTDADSDALIAVLVGSPDHGSLALNIDGSFTYTPYIGYYGADVFTYRANDGSIDSNVATVSITVSQTNHTPVAQDQSVTTPEDVPVNIMLSATDADNDPLTYSIADVPTHGSISGTAPEVTYTPDVGYSGSDSFTFIANDGAADSNLATVRITVTQTGNTPVANPGGPYLGAVNTVIQFDGSLSYDPDNDPLTYAWTFGDGATGTSSVPTHTYASAGVYDLCLTVNDGALDSEQTCTMAVVYDPSAGFVTGGGWIDSPAGAYTADESLTGKASFGFVSKYQKGAKVPSGNTEFKFQAGDFNFHSTSYEWLVVNRTGTNAQFKGAGLINGAPDANGNSYKFMLSAGDGSPDTFRIRIWWEDDAGEHVVYDNGVDQAINGGSIVVHLLK